eukprot:TRINITY_DN9233_c0_g1::TRINITY_DN9233_c0_g1_i1::g.13305::m.13305 TRINITY_DN9233_c0_g1::TRINITY_DN9233_c0_g1_i1::g.13305  ORF type:complete len:124 (+),score=8.18 TRINITY_DN9233_c0_g1_i1:3-374(+)
MMTAVNGILAVILESASQVYSFLNENLSPGTMFALNVVGAIGLLLGSIVLCWLLIWHLVLKEVNVVREILGLQPLPPKSSVPGTEPMKNQSRRLSKSSSTSSTDSKKPEKRVQFASRPTTIRD